MFLPYKVDSFSSVLPVLLTHVIQFQINTLVNPPVRLLIVNV
jgi:hypothetical protein